MKKYISPEITGMNLGKINVDGKEAEVVGVIPFIAAIAGAAAAVASAATSVVSAKQTYKDGNGFMDSQSIKTLGKVEE